MLVFIESNTTGSGERALRSCLDAGTAVLFLTRKPELYPYLDNLHGPLEVAKVNTHSEAAIYSTINQSKHHPTGVLTFSDYYVPLVSRTADRLGLPGLHPAAAAVCRNKLEFRRALKRAGLPVPKFVEIATISDVDLVAETVGYPCILKPADESGSLYVSLVRNPVELRQLAQLIWSRTANQRGQTPFNILLAEEYVRGPEFSVEVITLPGGQHHVVGVTRKYLSKLPHFIEMGHDFPADIAREEAALLTDATISALTCMQFNQGASHTEVKFNGGKPVVVEVNARLAGGMIPDLVMKARRIDLLKAVCDLAAGKIPDLSPSINQYASISFITPSHSGRLVEVSGLLAAGKQPYVEDTCLYRPIGSKVDALTSNVARLGHVIAVAAHSRTAREAVEAAMKQISVKIEPELLAAMANE